MKMCCVVERGEERDLPALQQAVAEHVARHVADADHREGLRLHVDAQVSEVVLHRHPGAARGDRQLLVIVAVRAARGERVAQPEAVLLRHLLAVSERCAVPLSAATTRYGSSPSYRTTAGGWITPSDDVVGDVEQPGDELAVAVDQVGIERRAAPARRPSARSRPSSRPAR